MSAPIAQVWTFRSSSGNGTYETLLLTDGTTSCNCPGWCRRVDAEGKRSCKHTRAVHMGTADRDAEATHRYAPLAVITAPASAPTPAALARGPAVTGFGQSRRRLRV
jgi:hypothetical protein